MKLVHKEKIFVRHWFRWYMWHNGKFEPLKFNRSLDGPSVFLHYRLRYEAWKPKVKSAIMK